MKRFRIHWLNGKLQDITGDTIVSACRRAGISSSAVRNMKRYEEINGLDWLQANHPAAYAALPEPYRADRCLEFEVVGGVLNAKGVPGDHLEDLRCTWEDGRWAEINEGRPPSRLCPRKRR